MIAVILAAGAALGLSGQNAPSEAAWTWTLYEGEAPVVLANEVPDTANLRMTLECEPGSSVAQLTIYGGAPVAGMARLTAHPAFAAFSSTGRLGVAVGDERRAVEVPAAHLAKLRRFGELCSG